ncbi:MAG: transglycosylase domain-containing protein [Actinomycetota bacterium]|nr:transglycosylase domain-containing protein [Actinomycetota bacterium]
MSARRERQRRRRQRSGASRVIILTLGVAIACLAVAGLSTVGYVVSVASSAPDLTTLKPQDPGRNSVVYAANGARLGVIQNDILRFTVGSSRMPKSVRDATVAIEDKRFYQHKGVDFEGIVRAAFKNLSSGETVQGGSTLSMQLVRTLYISRERTFKRKIREAKLAEELENVHYGRAGKEWILTKYLNSVPYGTVGGQTAVGIQAAARVYFDRPASELTLAQAAMLAGLPQAPSAYNPFGEPERALSRRNDVLREMAHQGFITRDAAAEAAAEPLGVKHSHFFREKRESYFFDYVTDELIKEYGVHAVRTGGLRIKTTIDLRKQREARAAIAQSLSFPGAPSSAIVTLDPSNGYIRAMASSARYEDSKFNLAADGKRQPGSAFKVMALVAAVREGINPATQTYTSRRLQFTDPRWGPIDVQTYGHDYPGPMNLVRATLRSDNSIYEQLALDIGPGKVKQAARDLGIRSHLEGVPAETLGGVSSCCSPLEMANAYATIASGGWRNRPKAITKVAFPDGKVDDLSKPRRHKAFDSAAMYEVSKILQLNIKQGTGTRANFGCPAAGKTGTTDRNRNAWFVGFTPKLATAVWVGFPRANIPMPNLFHGGPVDGGTFPAEIWGHYMKLASAGFCGKFAKPDHPFHPRSFVGHYSRRQDNPGRSAPPSGNYVPQPGTGGGPPVVATPGTAPDGTGDQSFNPQNYEVPPPEPDGGAAPRREPQPPDNAPPEDLNLGPQGHRGPGP